MDLHGIYVPLVTPFAEDGTIAVDALADLASAILAEGAAGIVALGTTAEATALDAGERRTILDVCAGVCRERGAPLIVGAGGSDTRGTIAALRELADRPEVSAALVPVPYYVRPSQDGVLAHFAAIAAQTPVPLVVYHIPYRTGQDLGVAALRRLAEHPMIAGVKYAVGGIDHDTVALLADPPATFAVLAGDDAFLAPMLALGAAGGITATAHLCTRQFADLFATSRGGGIERLRERGNRLAPLVAALSARPNPTILKGVLYAGGRIPSAAVRLPLLPAPGETVEEVLAVAGRMNGCTM